MTASAIISVLRCASASRGVRGASGGSCCLVRTCGCRPKHILGVAPDVESWIAVLNIDRDEPFQIVADLKLVGHAHSAVQLRRLLGHVATRFANLRLRCRCELC